MECHYYCYRCQDLNLGPWPGSGEPYTCYYSCIRLLAEWHYPDIRGEVRQNSCALRACCGPGTVLSAAMGILTIWANMGNLLLAK